MFRSKKEVDPELRLARKRVKARKLFYRHFGIYAIIIGFLFGVNMLDNPNGELWFLYPGLAWGVAIAIHYLTIFGLPGRRRVGSREWEAREVERELARIRGTQAPEPPRALPAAQLEPLPSTEEPTSNSVDIDDHLELKEVEKSVFRRDDLV